MDQKTTETKCNHCKVMSQTGTHGGCYNCGRVKHSPSGRKNATGKRGN